MDPGVASMLLTFLRFSGGALYAVAALSKPSVSAARCKRGFARSPDASAPRRGGSAR